MNFSNKNVIHKIEEDGSYLVFRRLIKYSDKIAHGYSVKPFDFKEFDKSEQMYSSLCNLIGVKTCNVVRPTQVHKNVVKVVEENSSSENFMDVDGLVTNQKNKVLSLVFADCTSFFLYDPEKNVIGNIHSGWRGTVSKIGKVAVEKMVEEYGSNPKDIICCIGPTIRECHFEVDEDVKEIFMDSFQDESICRKGRIVDGKQKYNIDAVRANINMFKDCGLKEENIIDSEICTACYPEYFHSYRINQNSAGRNTAIISLI